MYTNRLSPLVVLFAVLLLPVLAQGAAAPYTDWAFDFARAQKAGDQARQAELVRASPDFARIWFHGRVYDLVTPGVPDKEKDRLRPELERVAAVLAEGTPSDVLPRLMLDRVANDADGLAKEAQIARDTQEQIVQSVRSKAELPALMAPLEHSQVAQPVYYSLFHRAEVTARHLGGDRERALLLMAARRMAQGFALAHADLRPWRTLAAFIGGKDGVPLDGEQLVEEQLGTALNAQLKGDLQTTRRALEESLRTARASRGPSLYTALLENGTAHAAGWLEDRDQEQAIRVRVLQAVRPLQNPSLVALVGDQLVRTLLATGAMDDMVVYTRELRELGEPVTGVGRHLQTLALAVEALRDAALTRTTEGRLEDAERVLAEAEALAAILVEDAIIAVNTPTAQRAAVRETRQRLRAELRRARGHLSERRGDFDEARGAYADARALYEGTIGDAVGAARAEVDLARVELARAEPTQSIELAASVRGRLAGRGPAELRAENALVAGQARLVLGDYAPAFAHANHGLKALRDGGAEGRHPLLRARLHVLAAAALEAAGHQDEALARLDHAARHAPGDLEVAHPVALARAEAGRYDAALDALDGFAGEAARVAQVLRGCVLTRAGRPDEALAALSGTQALIPPHLRAAQVTGRTCLAAAHLARGDAAAAERDLAPARALILQYPTPWLAWRVHALDGEIAARQGRWLDAAGAWRQAADRYCDALYERPSRGATLYLRRIAMPVSPDAFLEGLPAALVQSAARDRKSAAQHHQAALAAALWARQLEAAPALGRDEAKARPAPDRQWRVHLGRIAALRAVLDDEALTPADHAAGSRALSAAIEAARDAARKMREEAPAWADLLAPVPPTAEALQAPEGEARLVFRFEDREGHLWLLLPGQAPRYYALPSRIEAEKLLVAPLQVVSTAPDAWPRAEKPKSAQDPNADAWKTLAGPTAKLLPFTRDKQAMAALEKLKLVIYPDDPLLRFPIEALVLEAPPRKEPGQPPVFLGTRFDVRYRLLNQTPGEVSTAAKRVALFGPLAAASAGCPPAPVGLDLCGGDAGKEADELSAVFEGQPGVFTAIKAEQTKITGLNLAFATHGVVHVAAPVDAFRGEMVLTPADPAAAYDRLGGLPLALRKNAATGAVLTRLSAFEQPAGLRRLAAALRFGGTADLVVVVPRTDADVELAGELAVSLGSGRDLAEAIRELRNEAKSAAVDPAKGGTAKHHPYYWARWRLYEK